MQLKNNLIKIIIFIFIMLFSTFLMDYILKVNSIGLQRLIFYIFGASFVIALYEIK